MNLFECITIIITVFIATITIFLTLKQFNLSKNFNKSIHFLELRTRFKENKDFILIRENVFNNS